MDNTVVHLSHRTSEHIYDCRVNQSVVKTLMSLIDEDHHKTHDKIKSYQIFDMIFEFSGNKEFKQVCYKSETLCDRDTNPNCAVYERTKINSEFFPLNMYYNTRNIDRTTFAHENSKLSFVFDSEGDIFDVYVMFEGKYGELEKCPQFISFMTAYNREMQNISLDRPLVHS